MNYVYDPKNQAQIEDYVNYVSPVAGTKDDPAEAGSERREQPVDLPERIVHEEVRRRADLERR